MNLRLGEDEALKAHLGQWTDKFVIMQCEALGAVARVGHGPFAGVAGPTEVFALLAYFDQGRDHTKEPVAVVLQGNPSNAFTRLLGRQMMHMEALPPTGRGRKKNDYAYVQHARVEGLKFAAVAARQDEGQTSEDFAEGAAAELRVRYPDRSFAAGTIIKWLRQEPFAKTRMRENQFKKVSS